MTTIEARPLEEAFDVEIEFEETDDDNGLTRSDVTPVVVFLLPGINSSKSWASVFHNFSNSPTARQLITETVSGPSDLDTVDLVFRFRLKSFRRDYVHQITAALDKHKAEHPSLDVALVCHSMGSAIFADIVEDIASYSDKNPNIEFHHVIFLGSVCKRTHNLNLGKFCKRLVNDVGERDFWPIAAWFVNPLKYDPVGRFGFHRTMVTDRIFPENDHSSCVGDDHLRTWVLPVVEDGIIRKPEFRRTSSPYNLVRLLHAVFWGLLVCLGALTLFSIVM
ncbi:alpha/beta hydrolase [Shimia sp. R11_0]|uniref:alpha/beta hydrolase n=1 Tax=Shimia sp. R11_0 TaxID=2821096 RepID=UPI001AD9E5E8|nr:alpha/beta hydrolase [Shimia sp. R11_0]MBO9479742.1 alpha/beta hydrolase [Shimia sp. R11_0]